MEAKELVASLDRDMSKWRKQVREGVIPPPHTHQKADGHPSGQTPAP